MKVYSLPCNMLQHLFFLPPQNILFINFPPVYINESLLVMPSTNQAYLLFKCLWCLAFVRSAGMNQPKYDYPYPPPGVYSGPPVVAPPQYYAPTPPPRREPSFLEGCLAALCCCCLLDECCCDPSIVCIE